ncbi:unnamed protein product [Prorocentrum cordatum]|uniref:Uncharacterized protein n=1 Tax=Prorocentrum cordatum TaxID=2364126 RepID=A0ABN9X2K4_9DINO|nr:unnamed protein product [Polarella glacialis]
MLHKTVVLYIIPPSSPVSAEKTLCPRARGKTRRRKSLAKRSAELLALAGGGACPDEDQATPCGWLLPPMGGGSGEPTTDAQFPARRLRETKSNAQFPAMRCWVPTSCSLAPGSPRRHLPRPLPRPLPRALPGGADSGGLGVRNVGAK